MTSTIHVGMAELNIALAPHSIRTAGLGSCVGVVIFDPEVKIAGLAHVMLPYFDGGQDVVNKAKYVNTAIPVLIEMMVEAGGGRTSLQAKLAGGAQMFAHYSRNKAMSIGQKNVGACKKILTQFRIPIVAEDTGGNCGRTIEMDTNSGILHIRSIDKGIKQI